MLSLSQDVAKRLMSELKKLSKAELGDITVRINNDCLTEFQAVIRGPENPC